MSCNPKHIHAIATKYSTGIIRNVYRPTFISILLFAIVITVVGAEPRRSDLPYY